MVILMAILMAGLCGAIHHRISYSIKVPDSALSGLRLAVSSFPQKPPADPLSLPDQVQKRHEPDISIMLLVVGWSDAGMHLDLNSSQLIISLRTKLHRMIIDTFCM
jgi:hypothetical protein